MNVMEAGYGRTNIIAQLNLVVISIVIDNLGLGVNFDKCQC